MSSKRLHAHMQIEYETKCNENCNQFEKCESKGLHVIEGGICSIESLVGVDPRDPEERKFAHDMLDEYLDIVAQKLNENPNGYETSKDHFTVFGSADIH